MVRRGGKYGERTERELIAGVWGSALSRVFVPGQGLRGRSPLKLKAY